MKAPADVLGVMILATVSVVKIALCGFVFSALTVLIFLQLVGGTAYSPVKFRESQPRAYWRIVAVYCLALIAVVAIFILWR